MERWQGRIASSTNQIWPAVSPWGFQDSLPVLLTAHPCARRNSLLTRAYTTFAAPVLADELLFTGNPARPYSWKHAVAFLPAFAWYAGRARAKLQSRFGSRSSSAMRSAAEREPHASRATEFKEWLAQPALAGTGLFDESELLTALAPLQPRDEIGALRWRRLATLELVVRARRDLELAQ
jgi:hypothetical protein